MTTLNTARLAAAVGFLALAGNALAADSSTLTVRANVQGVCKFTTVPAGLTFTLDPSVVGPGTASATFEYKCTTGVSAGAFQVGGQANGTTGYTSGTTALAGALAGGATPANLIQYSITWLTPPAFTGAGFGATSAARTVTLNGSIPHANFANMPVDTYSNTVAVTIAP